MLSFRQQVGLRFDISNALLVLQIRSIDTHCHIAILVMCKVNYLWPHNEGLFIDRPISVTDQ